MPAPSQPKIVIYAAAGPSRAARAILQRHGLPFREVATLGSEYALGYCIGPTSIVGRRPIISIDGTRIGGVKALKRLERLGVLDAFAAGGTFPLTSQLERLTAGSVLRCARARLHGDRTAALRERVTVSVDRDGRVVSPTAGLRREAPGSHSWGAGGANG